MKSMMQTEKTAPRGRDAATNARLRVSAVLLLSFCLVAVIAACGDKEQTSKKGNGDAATPEITRESAFIPQANRRPVRDIALMDHNGKPFDESAFAGHFSLVFVGYASCPDICPMTLGSVGAMLSDPANAEVADGVVTYFLSVDPERDTLERLATYVTHFHPDMVGITGSREAIDHAVGAIGSGYRMSKQTLDVSHTTYIYLVDPEGNVAGYLPGDMAPEKLATGLGLARSSWRPRVEFQNGWIRKAPVGAMTAGYGILTNETPDLLELTRVSSPSFNRIRVHRTTQEDGMATMEPVTGLRVPAGAKVPFVQGGLHLMLSGPAPGTEKLNWVTLRFEFAEGVDVLSRVLLREAHGGS